MGCELSSDGEAHFSTDLTVLTPQIQFERGDKSAVCRLTVVNDTLYEGDEVFKLKLVSPIKVLLGATNEALITIMDPEDGTKSYPSTSTKILVLCEANSTKLVRILVQIFRIIGSVSICVQVVCQSLTEVGKLKP